MSAPDLLGQAAQRRVVRHARREHDELLATPAPEDVVAAQAALQAAGDLAQHAIARGLAVDRVDALKVVDVEHEQARGDACAIGARELGRHGVEHVTAVVEAGEGVGARASLGLRAPALGLAQHAGFVAVSLAQRDRARDGERERDREQGEHAG